MFENIRSLIDDKSVQHIVIEGREEVTKIAYVGKIEDGPNKIYNPFDLLGYEKRSDTVELFQDKKFLGRGYISDIAGITVDITRAEPKRGDNEPEEQPAEIPKAPNRLIVTGRAMLGAIRPEWNNQDYVLVPCAILTGKLRIESLRFSYLRKIEGAIIDDETQTRYQIREGTRIEITMPDKKTGLGYICDPAGETIKIKRNVVAWMVDENNQIIYEKDAAGKTTGKPVEVEVKFAGIIGRQATADKISLLFAAVSGKEKWIFGIGLFLLGNVIGVVLHI
jgi:hypothetical protein